MVQSIIHNPKLRTIILKLFGKNQIFWKVVGYILKFLKMQGGSCVFCDIVKGNIPVKKIYEDDDVLAFHDINPQAPVHVLVIPKKHIPTFLDIKDEDKEILTKIVSVCNKLARELKIADKGFRIVVNTNPQGGQTVYHLHFHLLGGRQMRWPPG